MELEQAIKGRRSIRRYQDREVAQETIDELLDLARYAPSSMNGQPWRFVVVRDRELKERLARLKDQFCPAVKSAYRAQMLREAPVVIAVCVDRERSFDRGIENGVLATALILLAAHARGLGSVYMSAYKLCEPEVAEAIREALGLAPGTDPINLLPIGYPAEEPPSRSLVALADIVRHDTAADR